MPNQEKSDIFKSWLKFKKAENKAKEQRIEIEEKIKEIYGLDFKGNSKYFKETDIKFKVTIQKNEKYKLDQEAYLSIRGEIPENLRPEKITFSLDVKGYEYLKDNYKEIYKKVSSVVEFKINKPTIKVEKI